MKKDGFGHEKPNEGETNDWITPKWIISAFDNLIPPENGMFFDLDPCSSLTQPWLTARDAYTVEQNGLLQPWYGKVYCNPPYGPHTETWARLMAKHGNGIMLIFARLETQAWQEVIFPSADGYLFPRRRIAFCRPDGTTPKSSSGAPSAFVAWGVECNDALHELTRLGKIPGAYFSKAFYTGQI